MATATPKNRRAARTTRDDRPQPPDRLLNVKEVAKLLGTWETSGERYPVG
ncbi:hypothetical protein [Kitasatospora sp. NPDC085879]